MTEPQPFHVVAGAVPGHPRRMLLISYHFPPASSAGSLRWRKLAGYAAARGWLLDVVTLDPASLPSQDRRGLADLPAGTRVFGVPRAVPRSGRLAAALIAAVRGVVRGRNTNRAVPGNTAESSSPPPVVPSRPGAASRAYNAWIETAAGVQWAAAAETLGASLAARQRYDVVVTCGPPHMAHVAGAAIAKRHEVPLVADFRDPWRLVERLADSIDSPVWRLHGAWYERRVVPQARLIVMNTDAARDAMRQQYPAARARIITVMNGTDDETTPPTQRPRRFVITYSGSIYLDRDPRSLFEGVQRLIAAESLTPDDVGIMLVGDVQSFRGTPTTQLAQEAGVERYLDLRGHCPRHDLLALLAGSAVLVSLPQDSGMAIPSKLFEYMQFEAWLLALAEPASATARLLAGSAADVVAPADSSGIAAVLGHRLRQYRRGDYPERLAAQERFGRRAQANVLLDALDALG